MVEWRAAGVGVEGGKTWTLGSFPGVRESHHVALVQYTQLSYLGLGSTTGIKAFQTAEGLTGR